VTEDELTDVILGVLISFDKTQFPRPVGLEDHLAEAGVMGVLNTCLLLIGDEGEVTKEGEVFDKGTVDLPTYDLSAATIPGYS
jgi:hypothetical protein